MNDKTHLLVLDDEKNYLLVLEALLSDAGYTVTALNDPETGLAFLEESEVDVIVTDMKMPKITGREVLEQVKKNWPHIPVLIMTAFGSIESAVEVMKYGAFDYITKPFSNDELLLSVHNAAELARMHRQYRVLRENLEERYGMHQIIGKSRAIRETLAMVDRAAPSRSTVLISGESGTGKELVARAIHFSSPRNKGPFVSVNCMALNPGVLESELFGHEKGSFTGAVAMRRGRFEQAGGGTLFLDEIGELTPELQVKLLRVLQERRFERVGGTEEVEVDIRVVAATNKNLQEEVEKGNFREDLYYRLNVVHIALPPLRERREDIRQAGPRERRHPQDLHPRSPGLHDRLRMARQHPPVAERGGTLPRARLRRHHPCGRSAPGTARRRGATEKRRGPLARATRPGRHPGAHRGRPDPPRPGPRRLRAGQGRRVARHLQEPAAIQAEEVQYHGALNRKDETGEGTL